MKMASVVAYMCSSASLLILLPSICLTFDLFALCFRVPFFPLSSVREQKPWLSQRRAPLHSAYSYDSFLHPRSCVDDAFFGFQHLSSSPLRVDARKDGGPIRRHTLGVQSTKGGEHIGGMTLVRICRDGDKLMVLDKEGQVREIAYTNRKEEQRTLCRSALEQLRSTGENECTRLGSDPEKGRWIVRSVPRYFSKNLLDPVYRENERQTSVRANNCDVGNKPVAARDTVDMVMKKKGGRVWVTLECTEARALGKPPSRYITSKNRRTTPEPLVLRKYNKHLRRHTIHKEIK